MKASLTPPWNVDSFTLIVNPISEYLLIFHSMTRGSAEYEKVYMELEMLLETQCYFAKTDLLRHLRPPHDLTMPVSLS